MAGPDTSAAPVIVRFQSHLDATSRRCRFRGSSLYYFRVETVLGTPQRGGWGENGLRSTGLAQHETGPGLRRRRHSDYPQRAEKAPDERSRVLKCGVVLPQDLWSFGRLGYLSSPPCNTEAGIKDARCRHGRYLAPSHSISLQHPRTEALEP